MRSFIPCCTVLALLVTLSQSSYAQPTDLPPPPPPPPNQTSPNPQTAPPAQTPNNTPYAQLWRQSFEARRAWFFSPGFIDFEKAKHDFYSLSTSAPTEAESVQALELSRTAEYMMMRGLTFSSKNPPTVIAPPSGPKKRSTDELAMLYTNSVFYGIGSGAWIAILAESNSAAGVVLPMFGATAATILPFALVDSSTPLGYGTPQTISTGLYLGLYEGLLWTMWHQASADREDEWSVKTVATLVWSSSTIGALGGGLLASQYGATPGRASWVGSTGIWTALLSGLVVGGLAGNSEGERDDAALLTSAIGLNAGAIFGVLTAKPLSPSTARVRFIDLGGIVGGLVSVGTIAIIADGSSGSADDLSRITMLGTAAGIGTGLGIATWATSAMTADRPENPAPAKASYLPSNVVVTPLAVKQGSGIGLAGTF